MFCIICFIWNIREFYVSFLFNFILLQYYFSAEKPKKSDIVIASVLSLLMFEEKDLTYKTIPIILIVLSGFMFVLVKRVNIFKINWESELCLYWIAVIAFFCIVLYFFIAEYFNFKAEKFNPYFYENLIIISCIFGILNIFWQIHSCIEYGKRQQELKTIMNNSEKVITEIPDKYYEEDYKYSYLFDHLPCYGILPLSILLSEKYEVNRMLWSSQKHVGDYCFF